MLFHGFTLGALRQPEERLISIITGQRQTSGLNQLALHRTPGPSIFSPRTAEHFEGQRTPPARQRPSNSSTEHPSAGRRTGTPSTAVGLTKPQWGSARPQPGPPGPSARPGPRVTAGTWGATVAARPTDRCQLPRSPGARRTGRHEAAGGPRGGNQDHIQRESRLNFQPRVCRGAWSCLVNAAGNTWDTLTALIVPTHSAVDEL